MKKHHALIVSTLLAANSAFAAGLTNLISFDEETKIKGGFTEFNGRVYFACEKGGANNFGYLGRFDPAAGLIEKLFDFATDAKPKGGLVRLGDALYFQCEKGSATTAWGWIGKFDPNSGGVTEEFAYNNDVKPKSGLVAAGDALYYATEKGGAANQGMIERFKPGEGVTTLASLALTDGIKIESWAYDATAGVIYYGAREGGDLSQVAGKGAGAIGRVNVTSGAVEKVVDFHFENHGAKIRGLAWHAGKLWFVLEEGGDLTLENGKGGGVLASYDPGSGQINRLVTFNALTGFKPKALAAAGDDVYVAAEKGGLGGLGTFGVWRGASGAFENLAEFDAVVGAKPDPYASVIGNQIFLALELGTAGFLGGITAFELPEPPAVVPAPSLSFSRADKKLRISWPEAEGYALEESQAIDSGNWQSVSASVLTADGSRSIEVEMAGGQRFFRLRQ